MSRASTAVAQPPSHHAFIDWLRAAAILAVVLHHSGPKPMRSELELFVRDALVDFDVPVFLFASGFLYYRKLPIGLTEVGRRLLRVLAPYFVASLLVFAIGLHPHGGLADMTFRLATGSALGIYYYVFLIVISIPLVWPLSRMARRNVLILALCAHAYPLVVGFVPGLGLKFGMFGGLRNPLLYAWAYFLTGWVVAAYRPELSRLRDARPLLLSGIGITGIALWFINGDPWIGLPWIDNGRAVYSLCVVLLAALVLRGASAPRSVLLISQASYTVYLYHLFIVLPLRAATVDWAWWLSVPLITVLGVAGPLGLVIVARRVLGDRARMAFG